MHIPFRSAVFIVSLLAAFSAAAQQPSPTDPAASSEASAIAADLKGLVGRITAKMRAGETTAASLAPELAEFDALLSKYPQRMTRPPRSP